MLARYRLRVVSQIAIIDSKKDFEAAAASICIFDREFHTTEIR